MKNPLIGKQGRPSLLGDVVIVVLGIALMFAAVMVGTSKSWWCAGMPKHNIERINK